MPIFKIKGSKLGLVKEKQIGLEKHIQKLTEENLDTIFGWEFVASEFQVNNFFIDTLAFDPESKAFVIIEYKKDKSFSVIDYIRKQKKWYIRYIWANLSWNIMRDWRKT